MTTVMKQFFCGDGFKTSEHGMDLRDYFAAKAMQGLLSQGRNPANSKALAIVAYDVADKMIEERNIK